MFVSGLTIQRLRAFVRGAYRRLRVGPYRVLYELEGNLIIIVRIDRT